MPIIATNSGTQRELIPAGNYVARCYQMIHIGTVEETIMGENKTLNKVRIGWELPTELKVFREENGEQPCVISKEFTLSMHEKSTLRKILASWRGKDFSPEEAKAFDITKLIGVPCMLNVIHKQSKDGQKTYQEIATVSPLPKGFDCPAQINQNQVWDFDNPDLNMLASFPDFIRDKIKSSLEYVTLSHPETTNIQSQQEPGDDLPF